MAVLPVFRNSEKRDVKRGKGWILNIHAHDFTTQSLVEIPVAQKNLLRRGTSLTKEPLISDSVFLKSSSSEYFVFLQTLSKGIKGDSNWPLILLYYL